MIRLRKTDGTFFTLPADVRFVEITDLDGKVGQVLTLKDSGEIQIFSGADRVEAARYARAFKVQFCPVVQLPASHLTSILDPR